ncbi:peptidase inhibitor family I36 protein [Streptomyces sp. NPDC052164]|uniref:peptidase inhibitor family I36 protein n=1 Tax=Streptomyces sp. NPDC052164 TaxID=3155529 RepID=UPI00341FD3E4
MKFRRVVTALVSAIALAVGGGIVNASSAAAVGGCPTNKLCLYRSTEFRTMSFSATSTGACFYLRDYGLTYPANGINSYVNNLPVKATLWEGSIPNNWSSNGSIRPGGFSSDTGALTPEGAYWRYATAVCTGGVFPWDELP